MQKLEQNSHSYVATHYANDLVRHKFKIAANLTWTLIIMPRLGLQARRSALTLRQLGCSFNAIKERFKQEKIDITPCSLQRLEKKFCKHGTYKYFSRRKWCKKLSQAMVDFMNKRTRLRRRINISQVARTFVREMTRVISDFRYYKALL